VFKKNCRNENAILFFIGFYGSREGSLDFFLPGASDRNTAGSDEDDLQEKPVIGMADMPPIKAHISLPQALPMQYG